MPYASGPVNGEPASYESPEAGKVIDTLITQGYEQLAGGRFEEAVETFSSALSMEPQEPKALRGRGLARVQLKEWSSAAGDFAKARHLAPDDPENWIDLGVCLAANDQVYPAIEVFETLLAKQPDCVRGHIELGLLHFRLGAIPRGREQLQQALACRPAIAQRRLIEAALHEQDRLDRKRYYRPDFEALHQQQRGHSFGGVVKRLQQAMKRISDAVRVRKRSARHDPH